MVHLLLPHECTHQIKSRTHQIIAALA